MKNLISSLVLLLLALPTFSQQSQRKQWSVDPYANLGFGENIGQFEGMSHEGCLFFADYLDFTIFVYEDKLMIGKPDLPEGEEAHEYKERLERRLPVDPIEWDYLVVAFEGASMTNILKEEKLSHTRNFQNPENMAETIKANCYNQLTLENVYPNIDLILELPESGGLKYSFRVRPGGNSEDIKMTYPNSEVTKDSFGGLSLVSGFADFTDRAPISYVGGAEIATEFLVNEEQEVSFSVADYDASETLLIDPWLETMLPFPTYNEAYEVGFDDAGNCMVLGNDGTELVFLDNTGAVVWTWTGTLGGFGGQGEITTNAVTGDTYYSSGYTGGMPGDIVRLDNTGAVTASFSYTGGGGEPFELWRIIYNPQEDAVIIGSGGGVTDQISIIDADLTAVTHYLPWAGSDINTDNVFLEVDPDGESIYHMPSGFGDFSPGVYGNHLGKVTFADPSTSVFNQETGHNFIETSSVAYNVTSMNGFNGIAAAPNTFIYTYDGDRLVQYDKTTGTPTDTVFLGNTPFLQGGIDTDECGNLYVGSNDSILVFDNALQRIGGYEIPGECYDLLINGNQLYACGNGFATNIEVSEGGGNALMDSEPATCESCNGVAIATPIACPGFTLESISWSPDIGDTDTIPDVCEGWYVATVTWTDDEGEIVIDVDSVFVNTIELEITADLEVINESCTGACNGQVSVTPTAGTAPYTYELVGGETNGTGDFDELCADTYTVIVTDASGCSTEHNFTIDSDTGLGLDILTFNEPTCYGFTDGSITVETAGGLGTIDYTWVPTNPVEGATFNNLGEGTYTVYAESADFGCLDSLTITLGQPDSIYAELNIFDVLCNGDSTGYAVVDSVYDYQGSYDDIVYIWAPNYFGPNGVGVDSAYGMPTGDYTLTINDDFGCSQVIEFSITEPTPLVFSEIGFDPAFCRVFDYQSGNGQVFAAASGGTPDYDYLWTNLETTETSINSTWGGLNPGTYQIVATDANGCTLINEVELDSVNPIAAFSVVSDQLNEDCEGTEVVFATFINESENFSNPNDLFTDTTFLWSLDYPNMNWFLSEDYFEQPDTSYNGEEVYNVCLIAQNKNGCKDTTCKEIIVHVQPALVAPNIFSPGLKDGINDEFTFEFLQKGMETFNCQIVNRWGVKVAELTSATDSWDGTDFGGDDCTAGVYFYVYEGVSTNGLKFSGQGTVQLLRED